MKFLVLLAALLLEQVRPSRPANIFFKTYESFAHSLRAKFDAGQHTQGVVAWALGVLPVCMTVFLIDRMLHWMNPLLSLFFGVALMYVIVGFRQFMDCYHEIHQLIDADDLNGARLRMTQWRGQDSSELTRSEMISLSIEKSLLQSYRHVFAPLAWYALLGPAGAIFYRASSALLEHWGSEPRVTENYPTGPLHSEAFVQFTRRAQLWVDWLPLRLTAMSFAVVGNFQDAAECWKTQASQWSQPEEGIVLASGAGALGMKLGGAIHEFSRLRYRPELGFGDELTPDCLPSALGLIWRALVTWMFLIGVVSLAHSLG